MKTTEIDAFIKSFLDIDSFVSTDNSLNGIQVDNDGSPVKKIAFAVDAAMETFQQAAALGAGMLFVHHGLLWGRVMPFTGTFRSRIKFLLDNNICLYAVHLPLDIHPQFGNNAVLAHLLELKNIEPFGMYKGRKVGYKGVFPKAVTIDEAVKKISFMDRPFLGVFPFGKKENLSAAVVSGGAADNLWEAVDEGVDLFITGDSSHTVYHYGLEGKINMIAAGHYNTEVWGVQAVMHCLETELKLETCFIDIPTGL